MMLNFVTRAVGLTQNICSKCLRNGKSMQKMAVSTTGLLQQDRPVGPEADELQAIDEASPSIMQHLPLMTSRKLEFPSKFEPKQAWLETLSQTEDEKFGIVDLHPEIFGVFPRIDILWWNIYWQRLYKKIDYTKRKSRAEMRGGGRKPWPQKGLGKARHGSIRSPLWHKGGKSHGPRGPRTFFFMLPDSIRVLGLQTALTTKYAQDKLHIVDTLDLPTDDPKYLEELVESRGWGLSVLFVDDTDIISRNMALAAADIKPYTVMPVYGLNVYSMLKHETVVLTLDALDKIEHKLLQRIHSQQFRDQKFVQSSRL